MNNGITILIVDDEDSYTDALRRLFGADGYEVQLANNLAAGLSQIAQKVFDLVITDLSLGGLDILRAAKAKKQATEVIIITGYGSVAQAVEATKAGAFYFIEKPFEPEQIFLMTEKALEQIGRAHV